MNYYSTRDHQHIVSAAQAIACGLAPDCGLFVPEAKPIEGARGIDPCVLVDKDGSAYLFSSMNRIFVARLKDGRVLHDARN